jgi:hypothetical protein
MKNKPAKESGLIQSGHLQIIMPKGTIIIPTMSDTVPAGNTRAVINTGRRNIAMTAGEIKRIMEILITTITNIGKEVGKITGGTTIAGEIITATTIRIHTVTTNIIITTIITDM